MIRRNYTPQILGSKPFGGNAAESGSDVIIPDFGEGALCAEIGGDLWFPEKHDELGGSADASVRAKEICESCPLMWECRDWGLRHEEHGIWGGWGEHVRKRERVRLGIKFERISLGHTREKGEAA